MVSVIIPVFNSQRTLTRAFESILNQKNVTEIIMVDDGSTDDSFNVCSDLLIKYDNVVLIPSENRINKGACTARNIGLELAKSDWIQFLDADDELIEGKIESQIDCIKKGTSFIVGNAIDCFEDGHQHLRKYFSDPWSGLIAGKLGITSANLWNREALLSVGGWDESLSSSQEYELMFRLLQKRSKVGFCNQAQTKIFKSINSISNNPLTQNNRIKNWVNLRKAIKDHLQQEGLYSIRRKYVYSGYLLDFCQINNCLEKYNGTMALGRLFQIEKSLKQKIQRLRFS